MQILSSWQGSEGGGEGDGGAGRMQSTGGGAVLVKPITAILNEIVAQTLDAKELKLYPPRATPAPSAQPHLGAYFISMNLD